MIRITETWFNDSIGPSEYCIEGHHYPFRQDCSDTSDGRGGGVLLYVIDSVKCELYCPSYADSFTNTIWIEILQPSTKQVTLGIVCGASSEFVSSSILSWQILTAHAQPFR